MKQKMSENLMGLDERLEPRLLEERGVRSVEGYMNLGPVNALITGLSNQPRYSPNTLERSFLVARACYNAVMNPKNPDSVASLGDLTSLGCLNKIRCIMLKDETGRKVLRERPSVNSKNIDIKALKYYPKNTFGYAYYNFLEVNKVTPDTRLQVRYIENEELAYIMQRYRETHDFIHTITGLSTTLVDEVALKFVEMINFGIPVTAMSSFMGIFSLNNTQKRRFIKDFLPWAISHKKTKIFLLNVYYEKEFQCPIDELRRKIGIKVYNYKK